MNEKRVFLTKHSPAYWRVTLNNPPVNIFGPKTIPQLNEIITAIETDKELKVVVFDSAIDGFFLTHYDFLAKIEETTQSAAGTNRFAATARYAGAAEPCTGCVDRVNPRTRNRRRK